MYGECLLSRRILVKWLGYALTLLSVSLLGQVLLDNLSVLELPSVSISLVVIILFGSLVIMTGHILLTFTWFLQLRWKHPSLSFGSLFVVIGLSQIAKYIPGNFAHLVGRAFLIKNIVPATEVAITLLVESLVLSLTALIFAVFWWAYYIVPDQIKWEHIVVVVFILLAITPAVLHVARVKMGVEYVRLGTLLKMLAANSLSFLMHGLLIFLIAENIVDVSGSISIFQYVCAFSMAFLVGYLLPGAPGGVGVREYAFVLLMSSSLGEFNALQIIIMHRVITILGDLLLWMVANHLKLRFSV
jgi:uncharacterized membrane protein YbhN (UPF0104 family)